MTAVRRILSWQPSDLFWKNMAQALVGLFFIGAGIYKLENYVLIGDQSLSGHFQYWIDNHWAAQWYIDVLAPWVFSAFWGNILEISVIALQFTGGFLLLIGRWTRLGGALLLFVQLNVFLGTIHQSHFVEFVGISLWVALFYVFEPRKQGRWSAVFWVLFTVGFAGFLGLRSWNRFPMGDPWIADMDWQRRHFAEYVMPFIPAWKDAVLAFTALPVGKVLWAGVWWMEAAFTALLLVPVRIIGLIAGHALLLIALLRILTWLNVYTSQGTFWVLAIFVWVTAADHGWRQARRKDRTVAPSTPSV